MGVGREKRCVVNRRIGSDRSGERPRGPKLMNQLGQLGRYAQELLEGPVVGLGLVAGRRLPRRSRRLLLSDCH
jgi:hypothetical protein